MRGLVVVVVWLALVSSVAADPVVRRAAVDTPLEAFTTASSQVSPYLYLDRCRGGCTVTGGTSNNAASHTSSIPAAGTYTISEFSTADGAIGAAADADWAAVVQCMKEVYSPFAVTVTDTVPSGVTFNEV